MESWTNVIHTALLGTEKRSLNAADVDVAFEESFGLIQEQTADREEVFLQSAALVFSFRQCGFLPLQKESVSIAQAESEDKPYASPLAHAVLTDILETGSASLLRLWLEQCSGSGKIVAPETIPFLLQSGAKNKILIPLVDACCGRRGEWLRQFNADWKKEEKATEEERWQTGTLAERKEVLAQIRHNDPARGRELLQQTWQQESAATKVELLEQLRIKAGDDDVPWLEEVLNEKSAKVKEAAMTVLKIIPSSEIVQRYWTILQQSIRLVVSKGLLGIGTKTTLDIKLAPVDSAVFKTGIQPVSDQKGSNDEQFVLWQLLAQVPPAFWEPHFNLEREELIKLFLKQENANELIGAMKKAAVLFRDEAWLKRLIRTDQNELHASAFQLLPQKEAEEYALCFLEKNPEGETIIQYLSFFPEEWGHNFALGILPHLVRFPQRFTRHFYTENVYRFPVSVSRYLDVVKLPADPYLQQTWNNTAEELKHLLYLKEQAIKAFGN